MFPLKHVCFRLFTPLLYVALFLYASYYIATINIYINVKIPLRIMIPGLKYFEMRSLVIIIQHTNKLRVRTFMLIIFYFLLMSF